MYFIRTLFLSCTTPTSHDVFYLFGPVPLGTRTGTYFILPLGTPIDVFLLVVPVSGTPSLQKPPSSLSFLGSYWPCLLFNISDSTLFIHLKSDNLGSFGTIP